MARLWSCGFELQSVTSGVEWDTTTGSPTIDTTTKRSGAASLRCNPTTATAFLTHRFRANGTGIDVYVRAYVYITTLPAGLTPIIRLRSAGGAENTCSVRLNSNGTLEIWDDEEPVQLGTDTSALNTGQWYRLELFYDYVGVDSFNATLYIDGISAASDSTTSVGFDAEDEDTLQIGIISSATADIYFDDVALNNTSGTNQTGLPGAGSIVLMHPDSAGDAAATTGVFSAVDEVTPNDATDYIEQDSIAEVDYNFEASSVAGIGASDTITLVQIGTRQHPETAALAGWRALVMTQTGGTTAYGDAKTHNDTTWRTNGDAVPIIYSLTSYVDPQAGGAWTPALLDTMQAGVDVTDATPNMFFSTIWALVEYVPSPSSSIPNKIYFAEQAVNRGSTY